MRDQLLAYFQSHHRLVEPGALDLILTSVSPLDLSRTLVEGPADELFVTRDMVSAALQRTHLSGATAPERPLAPLIRPAPQIRPFELVRQGYLSPTETKSPLAAYGELFNDRFRTLSRFLKGRSDLSDLVPIKELARQTREASVLGMVREVKSTEKAHHILLTLEDDTGAVKALVPATSPLARTTFLVDEVLGARIQLGGEPGRLPIVRDVVRPETPAVRTARATTRPSRVLFLSDTHVGSKMFLEEAWAEMVAFLKGESVRPEIARTIEHVVIAGDLVDGIGIYPNQQADLAIPDIVEQYRELGRRLKELPSRLNVVAVPGNHDAVCPAEPQPPLSAELMRDLPENLRVVGNPSTFALDGVLVEAYHGRSFDDLIPNLPGARYDQPTEVMKRMLSMRHLAPSYGGKTPLAPLARDGMIIDPLPDIFVTGHTHTYGVERHRGILLLNASTWLAETEYQRMRNVKPVPARAIVVDLQTQAVNTLDFLRERPREVPLVAGGAS